MRHGRFVPFSSDIATHCICHACISLCLPVLPHCHLFHFMGVAVVPFSVLCMLHAALTAAACAAHFVAVCTPALHTRLPHLHASFTCHADMPRLTCIATLAPGTGSGWICGRQENLSQLFLASSFIKAMPPPPPPLPPCLPCLPHLPHLFPHHTTHISPHHTITCHHHHLTWFCLPAPHTHTLFHFLPCLPSSSSHSCMYAYICLIIFSSPPPAPSSPARLGQGLPPYAEQTGKEDKKRQDRTKTGQEDRHDFGGTGMAGRQAGRQEKR